MTLTRPSKLIFKTLLIALAMFGAFPVVSHALVVQGVHNYSDPNIGAGFQQGQAFSLEDTPLSVSLYAKRVKTGGSDLADKAMNILNIQCFEDSTLTTLCPDGSGSLDGSGYVRWNLGSCLNFTNTSTNIPMQTCTVGGDTVPREIFETGFITVPYGAEQKITLNQNATTTHVFNPDWYYFFIVVPVAYPGHTFGDKFEVRGSASNVYPPTAYTNLSGTSTTMADMYFEYSYPGENPGDNSVPGNVTTPAPKNIEILNPTYGTTTATTTFQVQIKYNSGFVFLDYRPTTTRHFEIVDAVTGELNFSYDVTLEANASENITITQTATVTPGSKFIRAMYLDEEGGVYSEVDEVFFNVATNTYLGATGLNSPNESPGGLTQIDCGTFDIGCQFQKALTFLFVPPSSALDKFTNLWQTIAEKKPFGYVTVTIQQLGSLNTSGATAFDLGTLPFMDSIFTPLRTALASILWVLFAIYFYQRRLKHLDI